MSDNYNGKTIGELIDDSTKILTKFVEGFDYASAKIDNVDCIQGPDGKLVVLDCRSGYVLIVSDGRVEAMFNVYEIQQFDINKKRGVLTIVGHETIDKYWFDDGEYEMDYTR